MESISHDGVRCHLSGMVGHGFGRWSLTEVFWICACSEVGYFGGSCEKKLLYMKKTVPVFFLSDKIALKMAINVACADMKGLNLKCATHSRNLWASERGQCSFSMCSEHMKILKKILKDDLWVTLGKWKRRSLIGLCSFCAALGCNKCVNVQPSH